MVAMVNTAPCGSSFNCLIGCDEVSSCERAILNDMKNLQERVKKMVAVVWLMLFLTV